MSRKLYVASRLLVSGIVVMGSCAKTQKNPLQDTHQANSVTTRLVTSSLNGHYPRTPVVITIAGDGNPGMIDATGTAAEFNVPRSLAVDAAGNIFVTDQFNRRIRMITPAGVVSTLSGAIDGPAQVIEGTAASARYCDPYGIAINATGTLYISDITSEGIRQISSGFVSSLAGNAAIHSPFPRGLVNANGSNARFDLPLAVAVEMSTGNVYVADGNNNRIRKITPGDRFVSTYAGSGTGGGFADGQDTVARFSQPSGVAVDAAGNVYVADAGNNRIRKITPNRVVSTLAGNGTAGFRDGQGTDAEFNQPNNLVVDASGNVYVSDGNNHRIRMITPSGVVSTLAGDGNAAYVDGSAPGAEFLFPQGLALDAAGNLYVVDAHRIRKILLAVTQGTATLAGNAVAGNVNGTGSLAQFSLPAGVAVDGSGNVYVADEGNDQIRKIQSTGEVSLLAGSKGGFLEGTGAAVRFNTPTGVAVDASGTVYVADQINHRIRKVTAAGVVSTLAGNGTRGAADGQGAAAQFNYPCGVAVDAAGNIYVADANNNKIRKVTPSGLVSTLAGSGITGFTDGAGATAKFSSPIALAVDGSGNVYVADNRNNRVRKITSDGVVSTLAGSSAGFADGTGAGGLFKSPSGVAVDGSGNVYVADAGNNRIRKITPAGSVSTLEGSGVAAYIDGLPSVAAFNAPVGIAVDVFGTLYVGDQNNQAIRIITQ